MGTSLARTAWLLGLALSWGSTFLWIEVVLAAGFGPGQVTVLRCALAAAALVLAVLASRGRWPRGARLWRDIVVAAALCNTLPFLLFSLGQQTVSSGTAGVLNATTPLWTLVVARALGVSPPRSTARRLGLAVGFAGVVLVLAPWQGVRPGVGGTLLLVGAAASYAVAFTWMSRRFTAAGGSALPIAAAQMTVATGLSLATAPLGWPDRVPAVGPDVLGALLALGLVCTALSFYLTVRLLTTEGATNTAVVGYLLPVVAVTLGVIVLDEEVSARVVVGMALALAGVALIRRATTDVPPPGTGRLIDVGDRQQ